MADVPTAASEKAEEGRKALDPSKFAYISDRTYTAQEVEDMTAVVHSFTSAALRTAPNAKMFLRSYWYRSVQAGTMCDDEMHIYTLARFRPVPSCACLPMYNGQRHMHSLPVRPVWCPCITLVLCRPVTCCDCVWLNSAVGLQPAHRPALRLPTPQALTLPLFGGAASSCSCRCWI